MIGGKAIPRSTQLVTKDVDDDNDRLRGRPDIAQAKLKSLLALQAAARDAATDTSDIDRDLASALDGLAQKRSKLQDKDHKLNAEQILNCETNTGVGCTSESISRIGDGPRAKKARGEVKIFGDRVAMLEAEVKQDETAIDDLRQKHAAALCDGKAQLADRRAALRDNVENAQGQVLKLSETYATAIAAGMLGRMPRTAGTPWMRLRTQKAPSLSTQ
jgi:hypothetical protein